MNFIHFTIALVFKKSDLIHKPQDIYSLLEDKLNLESLKGADLYLSECETDARIEGDYIFVIDNIRLKKGKALYQEICETPEIIINMSYKKPILQHNELYAFDNFQFLGTVQPDGKTILDEKETGITFHDKRDKKEVSRNTICSFYLDDTYNNADRLFRKQMNDNIEQLSGRHISPFIIGNSILSSNLDYYIQCRKEFFDLNEREKAEYWILPDSTAVIDHENEEIAVKLMNKCIELGYHKFLVDTRKHNEEFLKEFFNDNSLKVEMVNDENRSNVIFKLIDFSRILHSAADYYQFGDVGYAKKYIDFDSVGSNLNIQNKVQLIPIETAY